MQTIFKDKNRKPIYVLGLQSHNSSNGSSEMIDKSISAVKQYHGNTLEVPVYWYQLEPEEGVFDLSMVEWLISRVRASGLHLVILWFGFSKNCDLTYVPNWVKADPRRFRLAHHADGGVVPMMSPHCRETIEADKKAFVRLMEGIRAFDEKERTVIAVQVENEFGLYPTDRDYSKLGQADFDLGVPAALDGVELEDSGASHRDNSWNGRFGRYANEAFSSYYFGRAIEEIASAGKEIYPDMPLYVNTSIGENRQEVGGQS
ncbi:MAG: beta-galactosidase, partial [Christensenellaceae bacterium]|nr:beta-galactosidase [Christensenellaceae bacterium]